MSHQPPAAAAGGRPGPATAISAQPAASPAAEASPQAGASRDARPFLAVVRGQPTQAELAAVVAVLAARAGAAPAGLPAPAGASRSPWSDPSRLLREAISPGPGGWRRSALPR